MRIAIHHPAWHICGGGEAYMGSMAEVLARRHPVTLLVTTPIDLARLSTLLGVRLHDVRIDELSEDEVTGAMRSFDVGIRVATERVPEASARRNLLHVQVPIVPRGYLRGRWLRVRNRRAAADYEKVFFNSKFTASMSSELSLAPAVPQVLYPPVDVGTGRWLHWEDREPLILAVGRFAAHGHPKCQLALVRAFREMVEAGLSSWRLLLVGSVAKDPISEEYLLRLREAIRGLPAEIRVDLPRSELIELYERSRIFWHAAGMGVDETSMPDKVEHFGISTVEAMGRGLVPIVVDRGGQREIVEHGVNGFRWSDGTELMARTREVIDRGPANDEISERAVRSAQPYARERFARQVETLVSRNGHELES